MKIKMMTTKLKLEKKKRRKNNTKLILSKQY